VREDNGFLIVLLRVQFYYWKMLFIMCVNAFYSADVDDLLLPTESKCCLKVYRRQEGVVMGDMQIGRRQVQSV
jgi:hypothetical protein